jgi:sulfur transfer protein SufE
MKFDNAVTIARFATRAVVSSGAAAIVQNAVKATTPDDLKKLKKLSITVGTMALGSIVADAANKHVMKGFDDIVKTIKKTVTHEDPDVVEGTVVD